jgi:DNA invertase Pin-like site-specific DNA recombinase
MTRYGYARVSTVEQNLDRQIEALKNENCQEIFEEKLSGATMERPELMKMIELLKNGDEIVITDLTRFSRSAMDLFNLVEQIKAKGASLKSIKDTWLDTSDKNPYSKFLLGIMSHVSELERDLLKMRQAEGIAIAKKKGVYKGRPKTFTENNLRLVQALELKEQGMSYKEASKRTGVSESTIYRAMKTQQLLSDLEK